MKILLLFVLTLFSCTDEPARRITGDALRDELLNVREIKIVNFSISGQAACERCLRENIPITGLQIEVYASNDPMTTLASGIFNGLGPFSISNMKAAKDAELEINAMLYRGSIDASSAWLASAKIKVPEDDGEVVTVVLNF
ncbi:MAG: hypothetical protein HY540_07925 [Deltaproteobacteria bacterium]|nr:hypothetical protein [Deltaproteobacteria bacterium]